eukprot:Sdes_comp15218_c0_seq1m4047
MAKPKQVNPVGTKLVKLANGLLNIEKFAAFPPIKNPRLFKGDYVQVISGHTDVGKKGIITSVIASNGQVIVEGVNLKKVTGSNLDGKSTYNLQEHPIRYACVSLLDPKDGKPTRFRNRFLENGTKVRVAVRSGEIIPRPEIPDPIYKDGSFSTLLKHVHEKTFQPSLVSFEEAALKHAYRQDA